MEFFSAAQQKPLTTKKEKEKTSKTIYNAMPPSQSSNASTMVNWH